MRFIINNNNNNNNVICIAPVCAKKTSVALSVASLSFKMKLDQFKL